MYSLTWKIVFVYAIVSFLPIAALASTPLTPSRCPDPSATDPAGPMKKELTSATSPEEGERFLKTATYCPSACYDLAVNARLTYSGLEVIVTPQNTCTSQNTTKRGCGNGAQEPKITVTTKDIYSKVYGFAIPDSTIAKSRCDDTVLSNSLGKFMDGLQKVTTNAEAGQSEMLSALSDMRTQTDSRPAAPTLEASNASLSSVTDKVTSPPPATADVTFPTPKPAELALPGGSLLDMTDIKKVAEAEGVKTETPSPFSIDPFSPKWKPETGVQIEKLSSDAAEQPKAASDITSPEQPTSKVGSVEFSKTNVEQSSFSSQGLGSILESVIKLIAQLFAKTFGRAAPTPPSFAQPLILPAVEIPVSTSSSESVSIE